MKVTEPEANRILWMLSQINNSIIVADKNGNIEWVNKGFENLFGSTFEEIKNKNISELKRKDLRKNTEVKYFIKTFIQENVFNYQSIITNKQGEECWVYTTITPIRDKIDRLTGIVIVDINISEKMKMESVKENNSKDLFLKGKTILLVEDGKLNKMVAKHLLENELGAIVETASNGKIALAMIRKGNFDLVIMDIQMPEMNGYDTARSIRTELPTPKNKTFIIAMTSHAFKDEEAKCKEAGMNGFISKPIKMEELKKKLEDILT